MACANCSPVPRITPQGHLLLVEGVDEEKALPSLVQMRGLSPFIIIQVGGKSKFKDKVRLINNDPNFGSIASIGLVRDADENFNGATDSLIDAIKTINLPAPKSSGDVIEHKGMKIGIFVISKDPEIKMLEDLVLNSTTGTPRELCTNDWWNSIHTNLPPSEYPTHNSKAKVRTWLASQIDDVYNIGLAAQKSLIQFNHSAFNPLFDFLNKLQS